MKPYGKCEHCARRAATIIAALSRGGSSLSLRLCSECNEKFEQARMQWRAIAERSQGFVTPLETKGE